MKKHIIKLMSASLSIISVVYSMDSFDRNQRTNNRGMNTRQTERFLNTKNLISVSIEHKKSESARTVRLLLL